ncbi:hypothetical protein [Achromobacter sp.]|uniref:hypothetical protein n=1 Tax=Achromobacter sp. TaxID=134375 RepID=UPI0028A95812|nr:hypothetical protein [Achromobacter sp.]
MLAYNLETGFKSLLLLKKIDLSTGMHQFAHSCLIPFSNVAPAFSPKLSTGAGGRATPSQALMLENRPMGVSYF